MSAAQTRSSNSGNWRIYNQNHDYSISRPTLSIGLSISRSLGPPHPPLQHQIPRRQRISANFSLPAQPQQRDHQTQLRLLHLYSKGEPRLRSAGPSFTGKVHSTVRYRTAPPAQPSSIKSRRRFCHTQPSWTHFGRLLTETEDGDFATSQKLDLLGRSAHNLLSRLDSRVQSSPLLLLYN